MLVLWLMMGAFNIALAGVKVLESISPRDAIPYIVWDHFLTKPYTFEAAQEA